MGCLQNNNSNIYDNNNNEQVLVDLSVDNSIGVAKSVYIRDLIKVCYIFILNFRYYHICD